MPAPRACRTPPHAARRRCPVRLGRRRVGRALGAGERRPPRRLRGGRAPAGSRPARQPAHISTRNAPAARGGQARSLRRRAGAPRRVAMAAALTARQSGTCGVRICPSTAAGGGGGPRPPLLEPRPMPLPAIPGTPLAVPVGGPAPLCRGAASAGPMSLCMPGWCISAHPSSNVLGMHSASLPRPTRPVTRSMRLSVACPACPAARMAELVGGGCVRTRRGSDHSAVPTSPVAQRPLLQHRLVAGRYFDAIASGNRARRVDLDFAFAGRAPAPLAPFVGAMRAR